MMSSCRQAISKLSFTSFSKRVLVQNHSNENEFDLHENGRAGETHFHTNGFARRLVLTQRQKVTRKWPITSMKHPICFTPLYLNVLFSASSSGASIFAESKREHSEREARGTTGRRRKASVSKQDRGAWVRGSSLLISG